MLTYRLGKDDIVKSTGSSIAVTDPVIICPHCHNEIKLTESLAAPLLDSLKKDFERRMEAKDKDISERERAILDKADELSMKEKTMDEKILHMVSERLEAEKKLLVEAESERARRAVANELDEKDKAMKEMEETLKIRGEKLAEAQKAQAEFIKLQREFEDAKREMDLEIQKKVSDELTDIRLKARKEAMDNMNLKIAEKDEIISSMQKKVQELQHKADQASQQLQGEVLELELEELLRSKFIYDSIEPVPKGVCGGDVIHRVNTQTGVCCGIILWESKRTKNWNQGWLTKLRSDQREAKADISVIATQALPEDVDSFALVDGVWVCSPKYAEPMAIVLRHVLLEVSIAKQASEGMKTKTELLYQYLTGSGFRQRVEAIVEAFTTMREDLDKEKKAILKQWAKREQQIENVMGATVGMWGDLQGIAGSSIQEIDGISLHALGE